MRAGEDRKIWPHSFEFRLRVVLAPSGDLTLISRIRNSDSKPFTFTFAYHTYFSMSDISERRVEVRVEGLETLKTATSSNETLKTATSIA